MKNKLYPFDAQEVTEEFSERKEVAYYKARHSFPARLPYRHPYLERLVGNFDLVQTMPEWWDNAIQSLPFYHAVMLKTVTSEQFFEGNLDVTRLKFMRATMSSEDKKTIPQSPSIAKWLEEFPTWLDKFNNRGGTSSKNVGHIITDPMSHFYMSNGKGWSSCQRWTGSYASKLVGTLHDPYSCMAVMKGEDTAINETTEEDKGTLTARCMLRYTEFCGEPFISVDRCYAEDEGTIKNFTQQVVSHLTQKGCNVALASTPYSSVVTRSRDRDNYLGIDVMAPQIVTLQNVANPYMDNFSTLDGNYFEYAGQSVRTYRLYGTAYTLKSNINE